jgi:hypothetical protein
MLLPPVTLEEGGGVRNRATLGTAGMLVFAAAFNVPAGSAVSGPCPVGRFGPSQGLAVSVLDLAVTVVDVCASRRRAAASSAGVAILHRSTLCSPVGRNSIEVVGAIGAEVDGGPAALGVELSVAASAHVASPGMVGALAGVGAVAGAVALLSKVGVGLAGASELPHVSLVSL